MLCSLDRWQHRNKYFARTSLREPVYLTQLHSSSNVKANIMYDGSLTFHFKHPARGKESHIPA